MNTLDMKRRKLLKKIKLKKMIQPTMNLMQVQNSNTDEELASVVDFMEDFKKNITLGLGETEFAKYDNFRGEGGLGCKYFKRVHFSSTWDLFSPSKLPPRPIKGGGGSRASIRKLSSNSGSTFIPTNLNKLLHSFFFIRTSKNGLRLSCS